MVISVGLEGLKGYRIEIEADVRTDKEACIIIDLPDLSMKESRERIVSNLYRLNFDLSLKRMTVQLSPPDKRKIGIGYDCAMLLAILEQLMPGKIQIDNDTCVLGGLSLKGELVGFHGLIPALQQALLMNFKRIILPPMDTSFLKAERKTELIPLSHVDQLIAYFTEKSTQPQLSFTPTQHIQETQSQTIENEQTSVDFSMIFGHAKAKRVLEIAAAGGHHVLLSGPPGCGKSMLAEAFQTIQPNLTNEQMLETYSLYHLAQEHRDFSVLPPYRAPHHSSSGISLMGGGTFPKPGEISLAHNGVLFLDELGEFSKKTLDMLRQPLEQGEITISRVRQSVTYPSRFQLIAATNPCPCGYHGSNERYCQCTSKQVQQYQQKVSGPLLDRIDFFLSLESVILQQQSPSESSISIRERVAHAREVQYHRYHALNGNVSSNQLREHTTLTPSLLQHFQKICYLNKWSNRTQTKLLRIARTIADLDHSLDLQHAHIDEAIQWKSMNPVGKDESDG